MDVWLSEYKVGDEPFFFMYSENQIIYNTFFSSMMLNLKLTMANVPIKK